MNLILIKPGERSPGTDAVDLPPDDERAAHIRSHLGKKDGDAVSVGFVDADGGRRCRAVVTHRPDGGVRLVPEPGTVARSPGPGGLPEITLLLAVPFPARLKFLWPVAASFAAVIRIVVVKADLSNPEFCKTSALRPSAYKPMIERGMAQGGRTRPVKVDVAVDGVLSKGLLEGLGLLDGGGGARGKTARVFLDCGDEETTPPPARDVVIEQCGGGDVDGAPSAVVAVGPERGWTEREARLFADECGFRPATLGCSILRVDAAVVAGLGVISAALDECLKGDGVRKRRRPGSS